MNHEPGPSHLLSSPSNRHVPKIPSKYSLLLILAFVGYSIGWCAIALSKYYALNATVFDLGTFVQSNWGILHQTYTVQSFLGLFAFDGISFLLAPISSTGNYPALLVLQTIVISGAIFPLYGITRQLLKSEKVALLVASSYLLYFPLAGANWFDVHSEAFFPLFFLLGVYFYTNSRLKPSLLSFLISGMVRFPFSLFAGIFAVLLLIGQLDSRQRGKIVTPSKTWFAIAIVAFIAVQSASFYWFFSAASLSPLGHIVTKPDYLWLGEPFSPSLSDRAFTLILFLAPLLYLPLLSKKWIWFMLPFAYVVSTTHYWGYVYPKVFTLQYPAGFIPFLFLGLIDGLVFMQRLKHKVLPIALVVLISVSALAIVFQPYGPLNAISLIDFNRSNGAAKNSTIYQEFEHLVGLIPRDNSYVLFQNNMPQLLPRPLTYCPNSPYQSLVSPLIPSLVTYDFRFKCPDNSFVSVMPDYVLTDPYSPWFNDKGAEPYNQSMYDFARALYSKGNYGILAEASGMLLLKRGYSSAPSYFVPLREDYSARQLATQIANVDGTALNVTNLPTQAHDLVMWYGPYTSITPGFYNVTFWVEVLNPSPSDSLQLRITGDSGSISLGSMLVNATRLRPGVWLPLTMTFYSDSWYKGVEFTGSANSWNGTLLLRHVSLQQIAPGLPDGTDMFFTASRLATTSASHIGDDGSIQATNASEALISYGPYITLQPGTYDVTFSLGAHDATSRDLVQLQVTAGFANTYLLRENVSGSELSQNKLTQVSFTLVLNTTYDHIEFRCFVFNWAGTIEVSHVTLHKLAISS